MKSLLYVYPSSRATGKLGEATPDVVVVDLEEAVAEPDKAKARSRLPETVAAFAALGLRTVVRTNGADTPHMAEDLDAVAGLDPAVGLLLPKPFDAATVSGVAAAHPGRPLWLMAESWDAPQWLPAVLGRRALAGIVIGGKDLSLDLGLGAYVPDDAALRNIVAEVAGMAQRFRVDVFDAVVLEEGAVRQAAARAAASGCTGLSFVDPAHVTALSAARDK